MFKVGNIIVGTSKELCRIARRMHNKAGYEITIIGASDKEAFKSDRLATLSFYSDSSVFVSCDYRGVLRDLISIDNKRLSEGSHMEGLGLPMDNFDTISRHIYKRGGSELGYKYSKWKTRVLYR